MSPEDKKRLEHEAEIAKAIRGPDYSRLLESISRNKAEYQKRKQTQEEAIAKARITPVHGCIPQDTSVTQRLEASRRQTTARVRAMRRSRPKM